MRARIQSTGARDSPKTGLFTVHARSQIVWKEDSPWVGGSPNSPSCTDLHFRSGIIFVSCRAAAGPFAYKLLQPLVLFLEDHDILLIRQNRLGPRMKQIMILLGLGRASADVDSAGCVEQAELLNGLVRGPRRQSALLLRDAGIDFGRANKVVDR